MIDDIIIKIKAIKNVELDDEKIAQLNAYYELLIAENKKYNLTRIVEYRDVWLKHFYDSLLICNEVELSTQAICDIGTGAGLPGIVLKIIFPSINLTLLESNTKKVFFLKMVIEKLNLKDIVIINDRVETFSIEKKETQDILISRAVAPLNVLLEIGVQALKVKGLFICLKSKKLDDEILELNKQEDLIGLELLKIQNNVDDEIGVRNNVIYNKIHATKAIYPRPYGQIKKRPLGK